ncbi:Phosphoribosylcarboxyaminoimidazole (NCAIR) mutase [uncultured Roseburia sp.]|uniref:Nickel pincer cofactor biosynthesis protein LarB n=1 Tax=Brotonthovivens ammoniilytica TaxID=2981725 RepID=A0ABT2TJB6_9FIRM|nr:nickel pincer cofactor biosynthesis protein LarB [Brotonthovivens ammoniilytica]MCU6762303.1 nickel pincer cofactor biosynthesis protein LarB [Brotonthovivens ammoniilytica]SCI67257.1 Phosphoribosylcarboxyaminoimidazole (NCAIR) mutase [uncultured Roseburia sp.]
MDTAYLEKLLYQVKNREMSVGQALESFKTLPYEDLGYANIDQHRNLRTGQAEVIFGEGKTPEQIAGIVSHMIKNNERILVTRADKQDYQAVMQTVPEAEYDETARIILIGGKPEPVKTKGPIAVLTAGTSDIPVAEEAALTAEYLGNEVDRIYDVGVAGIHRLFGRLDRILKADVVIAIAGMEGALASVVGGLVQVPVIAVPTSVGYGANFGGLAALLSMLNCCANGIGVVNIDNGYGAACLASKIRIGK